MFWDSNGNGFIQNKKEGFIDYRKHRYITEEASRVQPSGWK